MQRWNRANGGLTAGHMHDKPVQTRYIEVAADWSRATATCSERQREEQRAAVVAMFHLSRREGPTGSIPRAEACLGPEVPLACPEGLQ
jgi:hypothetical protein